MGDIYDLAKYVVLLPFVGFLIQALGGKLVLKALGPETGKRVMGTIAWLTIGFSFVMAIVMLRELLLEDPSLRQHIVTLMPWIDIASLKAPVEFLVDPLSITMTLIITGIGTLIHIYSTGYMEADSEFTRFFSYLNLFIGSMLILVLANNLLLLFVGWEGVGLCSYLLIGFWYKDRENCKAANKAFIVNRIGDFGFMLGLLLLMCVMFQAKGESIPGHNWLSFDIILQNIQPVLHANPWVATPIALLLFVGAMGKSAQFPLYVWLPDAMAGPTPVSALIHAATMVTSGIFLLNRLWPIFAASSVACTVIACVGAFTALFAAVIAFGQTDIKKVLAFSTVSQLGYMFLGCGAGNFSSGMYHVTTHAFFKALLFLGAGSVIYSMAHNQDLRVYGRLWKYLTVTCITMVIGFLAIAGFPEFSGFFSKDAILSPAVGSGSEFVKAAGFAGLITALLTAIYMGRLTFLTFFGEERWKSAPLEVLHPYHEHAPELEPGAEHASDPHGVYFTNAELTKPEVAEEHEAHESLSHHFVPKEAPMSMTLPLILLAIPSALFGLLVGGKKFEEWLYPVAVKPAIEFHDAPWMIYAGSAAAILGIGIGLFVYASNLPSGEGWDSAKWNPFQKLAGNQFGFDWFVSKFLGGTVSHEAGSALRTVDHQVVDGAVNGVGFASEGLGFALKKTQSGFVRAYTLLMLVGALALILAVLFTGRVG